ncbi:hypothetical protein GGS23DRAFT_613583 [Durotheca rogersii]|uniref:uncharacterized protein n=1 Tax=Durotheca rogersii TaxID=419775 RepID=UPI00221ED7A9|nr:uncharacterized protein GGS23DRAFT_613583 [Durotheca rogersii]KAI5860689.1 hypothetical protein GGS23DRAFT_613583 [Durotheca rogersii]
MGPKRLADNEGASGSKRRRSQKHSGSAKGVAPVDPTYGQRGVFGNLEYATTVPSGDNDLDCEDDAEALAYLRSVREQASTIPHILVAHKAGPQLPLEAIVPPSGGRTDQKRVEEEEDGAGISIDRSVYQDGKGDFRGYYHDGAYVAYPSDHFNENIEEEEEVDDGYDQKYGDVEEGYEYPTREYEDESSSESSEGGPRNSSSDEIRDAYFASLAKQFLALRNILRTIPPDDVLLCLPKSNTTEVGDFGRLSDTFSKWSGRLRGTDPLPAQIAGMHKDGVIRLLRILLGGKFLRKRQELRERTSRWIWALLARLPDKGELDYQEIGWVRELGKRAVLMMVSLAEMEVLREHCDVEDDSAGTQDGEVDVDEGITEDLSADEFYGEDYSEDDADSGDAVARDFRQVQDDKVVEANTSASVLATKSDTICRGDGDLADGKVDRAEAEAVTNVPTLGGATEEASDVEMQIDSDEEVDGEVSDTPQQRPESATDVETAKARLFRELDSVDNDVVIDIEVAPSALEAKNSSSHPSPEQQKKQSTSLPSATEGEEDIQEKKESLHRARINERATLNMILTVAGEFYGQRDLLEFRDPFGGLGTE